MRKLVKKFLLGLLAGFLIPTPGAYAQSDRLPQRLEFIHTTLQTEARRAKTWTYAWHGTLGALTVGQAAAYPFVSDGDRIDLYYGIGSDFIGHAFLLAMPLRSMKDSQELNALIQKNQGLEPTPELLRQAEALFENSAEDEKTARDWRIHVGNALFNAALGVTLGLAHDRWLSGGIFMGSGIVVGEIMILSQPNRLQDQLKRYREGDLTTDPEIRARRWDVMPMIGSNAAGASLRIKF